MAKLNTLQITATPSVMLFGAPFTGKSLLAGKLAEHFNLLYIDMEGGHDVLFQLNPEWQKRIEVIAIPDNSFYPMAIETVLKLIKAPVDICDAHGKCACAVCKRNEAPTTHVDVNALTQDTIVIYDSATQLTSSAIANITKSQPDDYKLKLDDWGHLGKLMEIFFSHIQTASYNRIVISHVTEAEGSDKKKLLYPTAGSSTFCPKVAKFFDHVVYLTKKNKKHMAASSTAYMNNIMTGSRSNVAMEDMEEMDLLAIFKPEVANKNTVATVNKTVPVVTSSSAAAGTGSSGNKLAGLKDKLAKNSGGL